MADLSGAVDLSEIGKTLGPREAEALVEELRAMAQTREVALRDRARAEHENEGLNELLSAIVHVFGADDLEGGRDLELHADMVKEAAERVVSFSVHPGEDRVALRVQYVFAGRWDITKREPSEEERSSLPVYEELPQMVTRPGAQTAIVQHKGGLRIAEWQPE